MVSRDVRERFSPELGIAGESASSTNHRTVRMVTSQTAGRITWTTLGRKVWIVGFFSGHIRPDDRCSVGRPRTLVSRKRPGHGKSVLDITRTRSGAAGCGTSTGKHDRGTVVPGNLRRWGITDGWRSATRALILLSFSLHRLLLSVRRLMERSIPRSINRHRRFARFLVVGLRCMPSSKVCRTGKGDDGLPQLGASFLSESLASGRYHG